MLQVTNLKITEIIPTNPTNIKICLSQLLITIGDLKTFNVFLFISTISAGQFLKMTGWGETSPNQNPSKYQSSF